MSLAAGARLGRYEIRSTLGVGGMGEVYRAHDPETGREVAIKVSARRFDERFAREARLIASLNHPNICTLFDVGPDYLVMELVEGPTLAERIKQGAMPLSEALSVARQIAAALEYAHERPVIHRDLKPANIKIRPDGLVKVLDFGLAKVGTVAPSEDSPTLTMGLSEAGMILGTAAYMSPEQARGLNVDKRADIWSFGVVLQEMLTGERLFTGQTVPDILLSVISKTIETAKLPAEVRPLIERCLERDVRKRLRDMGDMDLLLVATPAPVMSPDAKKGLLPWIAAAAFALGLAGLAAVHFREPGPEPLPVVRTQIVPRFSGSRNPPGVVSPDGRWITLQQTHEDGFALFLRGLSSGEERLVADSEGTGNITTPFWSPDSQWVAFSRDGRLRKAPVGGGRSQVIAENVVVGFGSWGSRDIIIFASPGGIMQVPAEGGKPTLVRGTELGAFPFFLPDGDHFVHTVRGRDNQNSGEFVTTLNGAGRKQISDQAGVLLNAPRGKQYFFSSEWAQELDPARLDLIGPRFQLNIPATTVTTSDNGVLSYPERSIARTELSWYDRSGKITSSLRADRATSVDLSRDGSQLTYSAGRNDLFLRDQARGTETRFATPAGFGLFSPDGKQIAFSSNRGAGNIARIYLRAANGATQEQTLLEVPTRSIWPNDWSRDGRWLLFSDTTGAADMDLMTLPMDVPAQSRKPVAYIVEPATQKQAQFSPDGRFVAYASDESGRFEIYVRPFPDASAGKWTVSAGGGVEPRWNKDGSELYYFSGRKLMAVGVKTAGEFSMGTPRELFEAPVEVGYVNDAHHWQVAPDGRFLIQTFTESATSVITVITNWQELLKQ